MSDAKDSDAMTQGPDADRGGSPTQTSDPRSLGLSAIDTIVEAIPDLLFLLDPDGRIVRYRAGTASHLYSKPEDLIGAKPESLLPLEVAGAINEAIGRCQASGQIESCEYQLQLEDGPAWFEARLKLARDGHHVVCLVRDITSYRKALDHLQLYRAAVSSTRNQLAVVGSDYRFLLINPAYATFLTSSTESVEGKRVDEVLGMDRFENGMRDRLDRCLAGETLSFQEWNRNVSSGEAFYVNMLYTPLRGSGAITGVVVSGHDITPLHQARKELERLAHYDPLTGLPNRMMLNSLLEAGIRRARRAEQRLAVMFIDLDRFKEVNDTLGHATGDALLIEASARMSSLLRESDTLARVGGDEFVAILDGLADTRSASTVAGKLMHRLLQPFEFGANQASISCSIGISIYPDDAEDSSQLLSFADTAMYRVKAQGRNDWRFYTPDMTASATRHLRILEALRAALSQGALRQVYHPLIDLSSGACVALEALARWSDAELGDIAPAEFITIAEQSGLVRQLDIWSMRTACERMRDWLDEGIAPDYISVNFSGDSLSHPSFCDEVAAILGLLDIPADRLQLEIAEGLITREDATALANLDRLGLLGVRLAVDNFGRGYAVLSKLRATQVQTLKIDGSFIQAISQGGASDNPVVIASAIIAMGEALQMSLVASGIESEQQAEFVRSREGILGQGFFFGQPLSGDEAGNLMREARRPPYNSRISKSR